MSWTRRRRNAASMATYPPMVSSSAAQIGRISEVERDGQHDDEDAGADRRPQLDVAAVLLRLPRSAADDRGEGAPAGLRHRRPRPARARPEPRPARRPAPRPVRAAPASSRLGDAEREFVLRRAGLGLGLGVADGHARPRVRRMSTALASASARGGGALGLQGRDAIAQDRRARDAAARTCRGPGSPADRSTTGARWPCACTWAPPARARPRIDPWCRVPTARGSHRSSPSCRRRRSASIRRRRPARPTGPSPRA